MEFKTQFKIHFDEADPAGIAFSGVLFTKAHRCYEDFIVALGQDAKRFFLSPDTIYPLKKFEAEYRSPLMPLETYDVAIKVANMTDSSFTLTYEVHKSDKTMAVLQSVHVAVDRDSFQKTVIPDDLKQNLGKFAIS